MMNKGKVKSILKKERLKRDHVVLQSDEEKIELCETLLVMMERDSKDTRSEDTEEE